MGHYLREISTNRYRTRLNKIVNMDLKLNYLYFCLLLEDVRWDEEEDRESFSLPSQLSTSRDRSRLLSDVDVVEV